MKKKNSIIFVGSSEFAVPALELLNQEENYSVDLVITQPDKPNRRGNKIKYLPVKQKAIDLGLDIFQPEKISSSESEEIIKKINPDLMIVASYGQILKENILDIPKFGTLNIHASLLPKYRGSSPIHQAIINGETESGVTIMVLDPGLDTGPVLKNSKEKITDQTTVEQLHDNLAKKGAELLIEVLPNFINRSLQPIPQDDDQASLTGKITKDQTKINWNQDAHTVLRFINGLDSFPTAYSTYQDKNIKLFKPEIIKKNYYNEPGRIIFSNPKDGIVIECQKDSLSFGEIQYPGKKRMKVEDFLRGNTLEVGSILK